MAEVGLLPFARIALQVSRAVLPRYRSRFSKHQFTQPQLLAILCLMRYEDWTFAKPRCGSANIANCVRALGLPACPISRRCTASCSVSTIRPSTVPLGKRYAGCAVSLRRGRARVPPFFCARCLQFPCSLGVYSRTA